jgi:NAD-dependent SIR2 family protein deacetylase
LNVWKVDGDRLVKSEGGGVMINVTDVEDASVLGDVIAVVGDGIELFRDPNAGNEKFEVKQDEAEAAQLLNLAATVLRRANYVLVTCGAGMSADSGLSTYENQPESYKHFCDPLTLLAEPEESSEFWRKLSQSYGATGLHRGYRILDKWLSDSGGKEGEKKRLPHLVSSFCYTSNVDGLMRRLECFGGENGAVANLCEIHGFAGEWICADQMGRDAEGHERQGPAWRGYNKKVRVAKKAEQNHGDGKSKAAGSTCCGVCVRPNMLMFHDSDVNVLSGIDASREKYQAWEAQVEDAVCGEMEKTLVVLEIGCGVAVSAVREEGMEVVRDVCDKGASDRVFLVRLNMKDFGHVAGVDLDVPADIVRNNLIGLGGTAADLLTALDAEIGKVEAAESTVQESETRELVFDDGWMDEVEGDGVILKSSFGEFADDEDVLEKLALEEEEALLIEEAKRREAREREMESESKDRMLELCDDF